MDKESVNTSQFELLPEGSYVLTISEKPEKRKTAKSSFRIWRFTYREKGEVKKFSTIFFPWTSRDILLACGGELTGSSTVNIDWDTVEGQRIECDIVHQEDNNGDMKEVLVNISSISNQETQQSIKPTKEEQEAWDE